MFKLKERAFEEHCTGEEIEQRGKGADRGK
jgi:hypothetical protein